MSYWGLTSAVLSRTLRKPTKEGKAVRTTLAAAMRAPTGITGGKAPYPRTWIPKMMVTLGFTKWKRNKPTVDIIRTILKVHRFQLDIESPEYKETLRWEFYLSSYKERFFKHVLESVIVQLKLADSDSSG